MPSSMDDWMYFKAMTGWINSTHYYLHSGSAWSKTGQVNPGSPFGPSLSRTAASENRENTLSILMDFKVH